MQRLITSFFLVLVLLFLFPSYVSAQTHPFLITKESEYTTLRNRASQSPWKEMKQLAISDCNNLNYLDETNEELKSWRMRDISSSCSLSYILDPGNKSIYLNKLLNEWNHLSDIRRIQTLGSKWKNVVPPRVTTFNVILALDIIYNDLSSTQRSSIESQVSTLVNHYTSKLDAWEPGAAGLLGLWAMYKGNQSGVDNYKTIYKDQIHYMITGSGVFMPGTGYAGFRFAGVRDAKAHFKDVLEYTGKDNTFYNDSEIKKFYEYYYGYVITPFNKESVFGDSAAFFGMNDPHRGYTRNKSAHIGNAYNYSNEVAKWAAWRNDGHQFPGRLLNYVLMKQPLPNPETPGSRIFTDGGAVFQIKNGGNNGLYGALWNVRGGASHQHYETNAIYLAGYGEVLLNNVGYCGSGSSCSGFSWNAIKSRAVTSNTLLINYSIGDPKNPSVTNNHQSRTGSGVSEGFVSDGLDYVRGYSGGALPNGKHYRKFFFIQPQGGINGYFAAIDEVIPNSSNAKANIAFHPYSNSVNTISSNREYSSIIQPNKLTSNQTGLSIFYGTQPDKVDIVDGVFGDWDYTFVGKYLFSTHPLGSSGQTKQIVSILYPFDKNHSKANINRASGSNYTGAKLSSGGAIDYVLESSGNSVKVSEGASFSGKSSIFRILNGSVNFFFADGSTRFSNRDNPSFGFTSDKTIAIFINSIGKGAIISPGTNVTFYYPGIKSVRLNGQTLSNISSGNNFVKVNIRSGTHDIQLVGNNPPPSNTPTQSQNTPTPIPDTPGDGNGDGKVDGRDFIIWLKNFGRNLRGAINGDYNDNGQVGIEDYLVWINNY